MGPSCIAAILAEGILPDTLAGCVGAEGSVLGVVVTGGLAGGGEGQPGAGAGHVIGVGHGAGGRGAAPLHHVVDVGPAADTVPVLVHADVPTEDLLRVGATVVPMDGREAEKQEKRRPSQHRHRLFVSLQAKCTHTPYLTCQDNN